MSVVVAQERALGAAPAGIRRWVYLGEDAAWPIGAAEGTLRNLERVPTHEALQRHARELRDPYLAWIADLGVRNDSFEWWASELAAKNVYTFLFQRLCAVAVAMDVLADNVLVVCSTPALAETVAEIARGRGLATEVRIRRHDPSHRARDAAYRLYHGTPRPRPSRAGAIADDTLLATWIDERSFDDSGGYRDPHFGPLAGMLRERGHEVSLLARLLPSGNRRQTLGRLAACGEHVYLPEAFLTAADWRRCSQRARAFSPQIPDDALVGAVPAARLARELLARNRMSHAGALSYGVLIERLAAHGARPSRIVVPWEGHAWETALFAAAREHLPDAELIAYDNLNFSSLALSLYPGAAELGIRPLPDRVVTNGETFARILADGGFPRERIRVGCALRHGHLYDTRTGSEQPEEASFVLAAGSIDAAQTIEMVHVTHAAFGDDLLVKLHPASDAARIRSALDPSIRYDERPIGELLRHARAMIYTYSIVPYEALAAGVPPIFFQSQTLLDLDQLEPTPDVGWRAGTTAELRQAVESGASAARGDAWPRVAREALLAALGPRTEACLDAFIGHKGRPGDA